MTRSTQIVILALIGAAACVTENTYYVTECRCGDGIVDPDEQCDDGNTAAADGCSATCAIESVPACGDGVVTTGEACDDGNQIDGDTCEANCTLPACGNGIQDVGEQCDDGNTSGGDGCSAACRLGSWETLPPRLVSGSLACSSAAGQAGRKVGVDAAERLYVVMNCGGGAVVAISGDRGATWSSPAPLGISGLGEIAVVGGPAGVAYAGAIVNGGLLFTMTSNGGGAWTAPVSIDASASPNAQVSMASHGSTIYVQVSTTSGTRRLWRNTNLGSGAFAVTEIPANAVFHDVLVDEAGVVWSAGDDPTFRLCRSTDGGATFSPEINPPGMAYYSDWGYGGGNLYAVGSNNEIDIIPTNAPSTSTTLMILPDFTITPDRRALAANSGGDAFIATSLASGEIALDRLRVGEVTLDPQRLLGPGTSPNVVAASDNAAVVVFTNATQVFASVQAF